MSSELEQSFRKFAVFGDTKATGKEMTNKNFSKLCKDCKITEGGCTSTDVDIVFSKVKNKSARVINFVEFQEALKELSVKKFPGHSAEAAHEAIFGLVAGKEPVIAGATKAVALGGVDRLTDTSKYTGSHKERFDASGKGKGITGRQDVKENSGYVGAYKGKDSYKG